MAMTIMTTVKMYTQKKSKAPSLDPAGEQDEGGYAPDTEYGASAPAEAASPAPAGEGIVSATSSNVSDCEDSQRAVVRRVVGRVAGVLNNVALQTVLYMLFVVIFQTLAQTLRLPAEYHLDKHVMDRLVENHFDSSHNTFETVRRVADIYEWGNNVLWPGLFSDQGPCHGYVGHPSREKTCNDDAWPDGEGSFHLEGATPYGIAELVRRMDQFDWTEGITIRQVRASATACPDTDQLGDCYPDVTLVDEGSKAPFGYNFTHPDQAISHPFVHLTEEQLGSNPAGMVSAAIPSMRVHETAGFVALVIPFFSDTFLSYEEGTSDEVTDYRESYVNTTNGRTPRYYCVRTSTNSIHLKQMCDPGSNGDGTGRMTGAVRAQVEDMWNELKRGHWIDSRTRVVALFVQLKSNHVGVRYRITLLFELMSLGTILPSYDVETRILSKSAVSDMGTFSKIALAMVIMFVVLEGVECAAEGIHNYVNDMWNLMDWANFIIYFMVFAEIEKVQQSIDFHDCSSYMCAEVGYFDDWKLMSTFRNAKMYLSLCVCIQLFKILKFASQLIPKMGLATSVLRECCMDLLFFGLVFIISMLAFSTMLYVQLGPVMEAYWDQIPAFISLFRALFGDFDIQDIMDNSSGYINTLLFLGYLFVSIFIMLSMFLAILAEAQVKVREQQDKLKEEIASGKTESLWQDEYGIISASGRLACSALTTVTQTACPSHEGVASRKPPPASGTSKNGAKDDATSAVSAVVLPSRGQGPLEGRLGSIMTHDASTAARLEQVLQVMLNLQGEVAQLREQLADRV